MGGPGSGKGMRLRKRSKPFVHELPSIDAYTVFHRGYEFAKIQVFSCSDFFFRRIGLYSFEIRDREGQLSCLLNISPVQCLKGSIVRYLFICPGCEQKRRYLFFFTNRLACRGCLHLAFKSQNECLSDRLSRKRTRLASQLKSCDGTNLKPKGMHWKVYDRLLQKSNQLKRQELIALLYSERNMRLLAEKDRLLPREATIINAILIGGFQARVPLLGLC